MTTYRLTSTDCIHTPSIIEYAIAGYDFDSDKSMILKWISESFPDVPETVVEQLLSKEIGYKVNGEEIVFTATS